jgi:hypothetical protein
MRKPQERKIEMSKGVALLLPRTRLERFLVAAIGIVCMRSHW